MPRKWWKDNEECLPTRYLYLNLAEPLKEENERMMKYNFLFLTEEEAKYANEEGLAIWYKVNDILLYPDELDLDEHIEQQGENQPDDVGKQ